MPDLAHAALGRKVRTLREAAGLSQQALAERSGLAIRTMTRLEQGEATKVATVEAVAAALGTTASELLAEAS